MAWFQWRIRIWRQLEGSHGMLEQFIDGDVRQRDLGAVGFPA